MALLFNGLGILVPFVAEVSFLCNFSEAGGFFVFIVTVLLLEVNSACIGPFSEFSTFSLQLILRAVCLGEGLFDAVVKLVCVPCLFSLLGSSLQVPTGKGNWLFLKLIELLKELSE